jgi:hypothetical protein
MSEFTTSKPITLPGTGNVTAQFLVHGQDLMVRAVRFCRGEGNCVEAGTVPITPTDINGNLQRGYDFVYSYLQARDAVEARPRIRGFLEKLSGLRAKLDSGSDEAARPMTSEMKDTLDELQALVEKDNLDGMELTELNAWKLKLEAMAGKLQFKLEG